MSNKKLKFLLFLFKEIYELQKKNNITIYSNIDKSLSTLNFDINYLYNYKKILKTNKKKIINPISIIIILSNNHIENKNYYYYYYIKKKNKFEKKYENYIFFNNEFLYDPTNELESKLVFFEEIYELFKELNLKIYEKNNKIHKYNLKPIYENIDLFPSIYHDGPININFKLKDNKNLIRNLKKIKKRKYIKKNIKNELLYKIKKFNYNYEKKIY